MDRYKKLAFNSIIFATGNMGSKLISLLLIPLYTYYLSTGQYGTVDLVTNTLNLMVPIITLSIYDAVLRFIMDKSYDKKLVLNSALILTIIGYLLTWIVFPILKAVFPFDNFLLYFYILLLTSSVNSSLMQFVRANNQVKLFALTGIISSVVVFVGNILFLVVFHLGIVGYLISLIIADIVSLIILCSVGRIYRYLFPFYFDFKLLKNMLVYSIPLVPNTLMWWVMSVSDRYIITFFIGVGANGLYAVANKIPSILGMVNSIFIQAWQMSAIEEADSQSRSQFYSNIFNILSAIMFIITSLLLIFLKLIMHYVISANFYDAWKFVPFLLLSVVFSNFSAFLGTNYIAAKKTIGAFRTSIIGAVINIIVNFLLVPIIGINGASLSTMLSFLAVWIIRIVETKSFIRITFNVKKILGNLIVISFQIIVIYSNLPIQLFLQLALFFIIVLINWKEIIVLSIRVYGMIIKK